MRRKKASGAGNKGPLSHQSRDRYGTSMTETAFSVSSFIQSALSEGGEGKKEMYQSDTLHEEEKYGGPRFIRDNHENDSVAERVKRGRTHRESRSRTKKTNKLGKTL